ncbi:nuclear transport factor 2 family protein [Zavarzinia compransoris]|uniref:DUF4440 domain-containing protein n=1 Tax=Zavarzinia compransoris TaxID=1264899 RepID=A0A317DWW4_9PROT|nr:nuclear transport factor 2 family protein [Zavarzinia compransoris]PWR19179.1 DUF4440 domain-containing protein [Zavarzinia compransoris]TDP49195.1 SnoaL-like protein [Zavarzinia compransoris]
MSKSVEAAVLAANRAFYAAFRRRDIRAMAALWSIKGPIACIHPGWPPLTDRDQVMEAWRQILANPDSPDVQVRGDEALLLSPTVAMVILVEVIAGHGLSATNVLVLEDGEWRLCHHQASPLAAPAEDGGPAPERGRLH